MCEITKENDSLQRQTENKDENSQKIKLHELVNIPQNKILISEISPKKYISTENMISNFGGITQDKHIPKARKINKFLKNDILISNIRPYLKKIWLAEFDGGCSTDIIILRPKDSKMILYLFYALSTDNFFNYMMKTSKGTKMPRGDKKAVLQYTITLNKIFQELYTNLLVELDKKIELMEKKHTLYQNIKKYYSNVLFSNTSDWNKKNLKDIAIIKMGFTPSTKKEEYWNGNIKWLAVSDMGSKYISKTKKHITKIAIGKKEIIKKDTLVMSFKLTIGKLGILKEDMYSNEAICNFQWKNKNINTEFMYYYLSSINLKKYGSQAAKGITLNKETLNMIPIRIPSYETQINIVNILSNIDIKLEYLSKKINYEKRYKKGLLQKMFV